MTDTMDALRADLSNLEGPARTRPLIELGRLLADQYWRLGPGQPTALRWLNEAVDALDEAYQYFDPADVLRGNTAAMLGGLYAVRYVAHGGAVQDRERGIVLLEETLSFPTTPAMLRGFSRAYLGQLYLRRATESLQGDKVMSAMLAGQSPAAAADADRAVACFRAVLDDTPARNAEFSRAAEAMLTAAEAIQTLMSGFGGGPGGFDLARMMAAVESMQRLQQAGGGAGASFVPAVPNVFDVGTIASLDALDRPTTVTAGPDPAETFRPRPRPEPVAIDVGRARRELSDRLSHAGGIRRLLHLSELPVDMDLDELVGLATAMTYRQDDTADQLLLAAALFLRGRFDDDGNDDEWGDSAHDIEAAIEALAAAAATVSGEDLDLLLILADRLGRPDLAVARLAPAADALQKIGASALIYSLPDGGLVLDAATGQLVSAPTDLPAAISGWVILVSDDFERWTRLVGKHPMSFVANVPQLVRLAARAPRPPLTRNAVFVADPRGERGALEWSSIETMLLRRLLYRHSVGLGHTIEYVDGAGTADDVRAHLDASMLFLGCGIEPPGVLRLAGPTELDLTGLTAGTTGGLAILPPLAEGFPAVADALLAAGFTGVIGWRRAVPAPVATAMLFLLHMRLVDDGLAPARAVQAVRAHVHAANPEPAPGLPDSHAATLAGGRAKPYADDLMHRGV